MFSKTLIKVYITRIVAILASMLSYTIVIPKLTSNIGAYGIYSVIVSLLLLLQYADLGFLGAGQKYAAERFARNDLEGEIKILSFVHFILFIVVILYGLALLYVYFNPRSVFNTSNLSDLILAKNLIIIFIGFSPVIVLQRYASAVFSIRIEDYILQTVEIISNIFKIGSTFYYFKQSTYDITGYIFFIQLMNLISASVCFVIIKYKYKYDFSLLVKSFKFNKEVFQLTKNMAFTSIVITISWILYYEMDSVYVSKLYNPQTVALFAIGITILTFSRTLMNMLLSPFQMKFNHLRGLKDEIKLSQYFLRLIEWAFPVSILPPICIFIMMKPLIFAWVGHEYINSILISKILILNLCFAFLAVPISYLAMAREKFKFLLVSSVSLPFFYLLFFLLIRPFYDIYALPIAKILTLLVSLMLNLYLLKEIIEHSLVRLLFTIFGQCLLPILLLLGMLYLLNPFWLPITEKNTLVLLRTVIIGASCTMISIICYYLINRNTRLFLIGFLKRR